MLWHILAPKPLLQALLPSKLHQGVRVTVNEEVGAVGAVKGLRAVRDSQASEEGEVGSIHVSVEEGIHAEVPLRLLFSAQGPTKSRLMVTLGAQSSLVLFEELTGGSALAWEHAIDVRLDDGAFLEHIRLEHLDEKGTVKIVQRMSLQKHAKSGLKIFALSGQKLQTDLHVSLDGADAVSDSDTVFFARSDHQYSLNARTIFGGARGGGEMTMRGVAEEKAMVSVKGLIDIAKRGGGTHTYLTQSVLMLDPTAKVDAVPGLEIKTNDVKASHSATVSRVTPEDLFYFASRGMQEQEARRMYVEGFLASSLEKISDAVAREKIHEAIARAYAKNLSPM